jgi:uncharacterized membrane protein
MADRGPHIVIALILSAVLFGFTPMHEGHHDEGAAPRTDSSSAVGSAKSETVPQHETAYTLKFWRSLKGHLHNKIVHVPIGFVLSAFFLSLLAFRRPELNSAIRWLVLTAAFGSLLAYLTGTGQEEFFEGGGKEWLVNMHERFAITTAAVLWGWAAAFWVQILSRYRFFFGTAAMLLVIITAFLGGVIAHG